MNLVKNYLNNSILEINYLCELLFDKSATSTRGKNYRSRVKNSPDLINYVITSHSLVKNYQGFFFPRS